MITEVDEKNKQIRIRKPANLVTETASSASGEEDAQRQYTFDSVFGMDCKQRDVYEQTSQSIVESCLNGYNGTIFAYGSREDEGTE